MTPAGHPFWWALAGACLLWYSTVTIAVAIRGARDIRRMLDRLGRSDELENRGEKVE